MKRKILHILAGMARGGCEGNALCVISHAQDCDHDVLVLGEEGAMSADFVSAGARMEYLGPPSRLPWRLSSAIRKALANSAPCGVICWHGMVCLPEILHALSDSSLPIVVHGGNPAYSMPAWVDWRYFALEKCLGKRAGATYACCSEHVAHSFRNSLYLRRFPTTVVPNGVKVFDEKCRRSFPINNGEDIRLGMVARLDSIKDHATLLRAYALVKRRCPQVSLAIVGDGPLREPLQRLTLELGLSTSTFFLGQISDVYSVISEWDIFCYATTIQEGLGNALIEAMMAGLPCVATDVGPIKEIAGEPSAVKLVRPADPEDLANGILSLIQNMEARRNLADVGRQRAQSEFSQAVFTQRYLNLIFSQSHSQDV